MKEDFSLEELKEMWNLIDWWEIENKFSKFDKEMGLLSSAKRKIARRIEEGERK